MNAQYKTCSACKIEKSIEDFHKRKENGTDGRKSACKICRNKKRSEYAKNNKEKENNRVKKWREDNPDKKLKADRKWRKKNPNKVRFADRLWKSKNVHKLSAQAAKRRAMKQNIEENFSARDRKIVFAKFKYKCFVCGSKDNIAIDHHMPLSEGHALTHNNAVVLCRSCNSSKGAKLPEEFYTFEQIGILDKIIK